MAAPRPPTLWQVISSVGAAFFGVQSSRNRERDFRHGNPAVFVAVGLAAAALLVLMVILTVKLVLKGAGL